MTEKQTIRRLWVQHDFMENWLANILMHRLNITHDQARGRVAERCERAMRTVGLKYPFKDTDE